MNIGFWNINNKELSDSIVELVLENDLDIICLAEAKDDTIAEFTKKVNLMLKDEQNFNKVICSKNKVHIFTRYEKELFEDTSHLYNSLRLVAQKIKISSKLEINLVGIHFHSKNNWTDISLAMECVTIANAITKIEENTKNTHTVLIGDFNMNPFESGIVSANGLHAIPDLEYAKNTISRDVDETSYPFFYNPMWNFFGDSKTPLGTYYYRSSGNVSYEWHIFDQILIRPSLNDYLTGDYVNIITKIGGESLINSLKRPDKSQYSDHLPIVLKLNF